MSFKARCSKGDPNVATIFTRALGDGVHKPPVSVPCFVAARWERKPISAAPQFPVETGPIADRMTEIRCEMAAGNGYVRHRHLRRHEQDVLDRRFDPELEPRTLALIRQVVSDSEQPFSDSDLGGTFRAIVEAAIKAQAREDVELEALAAEEAEDDDAPPGEDNWRRKS